MVPSQQNASKQCPCKLNLPSIRPHPEILSHRLLWHEVASRDQWWLSWLVTTQTKAFGDRVQEKKQIHFVDRRGFLSLAGSESLVLMVPIWLQEVEGGAPFRVIASNNESVQQWTDDILASCKAGQTCFPLKHWETGC